MMHVDPYFSSRFLSNNPKFKDWEVIRLNEQKSDRHADLLLKLVTQISQVKILAVEKIHFLNNFEYFDPMFRSMANWKPQFLEDGMAIVEIDLDLIEVSLEVALDYLSSVFPPFSGEPRNFVV